MYQYIDNVFSGRYVQYYGLFHWCVQYTFSPDSVTQQIGKGLGYQCPSTLFFVTVEPPKRKLPHTQLCPFPSPPPMTPQCWLCGFLCPYKAGWSWLPVIVTKSLFLAESKFYSNLKFLPSCKDINFHKYE